MNMQINAYSFAPTAPKMHRGACVYFAHSVLLHHTTPTPLGGGAWCKVRLFFLVLVCNLLLIRLELVERALFCKVRQSHG